jgi:hypothetical protein
VNQKIYQKILLDTQGDISQITANYIKETFDIDCNQKFTSIEEYVQYIDNQCLECLFFKNMATRYEEMEILRIKTDRRS